MSFIAILMALLIEQVRPLTNWGPIDQLLRAWAGFVGRNFDAGRPSHGWIVWGIVVVLPAAATLLIHWLLIVFLGWIAAVAWSIAVLYVTLGFRQFSHHFTEIHDALQVGDEARARDLLARWQQVDAGELPRSEIIRHVIEHSVLASHRHVFGVLGWYSVLAAIGLGPAGAVFYRMSEFAARTWRNKSKAPALLASTALQSTAVRAWAAIDWLPARTTALAFAVMGNFEEAIDNWRNHVQTFPNDNDGVILAATAGAINVRLGGEALRASYGPNQSQGFQASAAAGSPAAQTTPGREPDIAHLRAVVGLVWRSVVLWMLLLALLSLANLLG